MRIWVDSPLVDGDRVLFSWRQTGENPFQRANQFYFRYEGIDLSRFSNQLLFEVFLSLQLKIFAHLPEPVELTFPEPIAVRTVEYWSAYHRAHEVSIGPIADVERYEPVSAPLNHPARRAAVFYGGGKDSVVATGMLTELLGDDQVVLIQYVAPITPTDGAMRMHERRQEKYMLGPIRQRRGVATQRVFTNYLANLNDVGIRHRPHREFFTAGSLPALIAWGAEYSTFGDTRTDFAILKNKNRERHYMFAGSRPEFLAAQSAHYRNAIGLNHRITNLNFAFATNQDHVLLIRRYPELLPATVPCTTGNSSERFCHRCHKCMIWAVFGLAADHVDPDMDYDRIFTENQWVLSIVRYAQSGAELSHYGNAPWIDGLMKYPHVYQPVCHSLARLDPSILGGRIGAQAETNLYIMMALLGNTEFANQEVVAQEIFDFVDIDLMYRVADLAAEHHPRVDELPRPWLFDTREAIIDYKTRMPTRLDNLPHLQP